MQKTPRTANTYMCKKCNFECSKQSDFDRHLATTKHRNRTNNSNLEHGSTQETSKTFICICGKKYSARNSLWYHKKKCTFHEPIEEEPISSSEDKLLIEQLMKDNSELKNMFVSVLEQFQLSQQQNQENTKVIVEQNQENTKVIVEQNQENTKVLANTIVESMSKMGNTTNNNIDNRKITINQYLTETCVNAENIHDFTDRFVEGCGGFFENNWRKIDCGQVDFVDNTRETFFKYLAENPQHMKFVQTTDVKRGVLYLKKKEKDGRIEDSSFVKYEDGFGWAGNYIQHRLLQKLVPLQTFAIDTLKRECGNPPLEDDYSSKRDYDEACDRYKDHRGKAGRGILFQIHRAYNFIDRKGECIKIMEKSKIQHGFENKYPYPLLL